MGTDLWKEIASQPTTSSTVLLECASGQLASRQGYPYQLSGHCGNVSSLYILSLKEISNLT
nr:CIH_HP1_G0025280.mRNA.1.CDS.1 [Saccharomyces cerevisiae]